MGRHAKKRINVYPFGLEHKGYNGNINGVENDYKQFQGQEWTEDLGLNIHEWKYRISDPAIGRFWQVDPLAEDYSYQSPYNFSENRVIDSRELEGLERIYAADGKFIGQVGDNQDIRVMHNTDGADSAQRLVNTANNTELSSEERAAASSTLNSSSFEGFKNTDEAATSFLKENFAESYAADVEIGAKIYDVELEGGGTVSILTPKLVGTKKVDKLGVTVRELDMDEMVGPKVSLGGETIVTEMPGTLSGTAHTHGKGSNKFSPENMLGGGDKGISRKKNIPVYMVGPNKEIRKYDHNRGVIDGRLRRNKGNGVRVNRVD
ncbi:hypothetical protein [Maribacter sp. 2-571]|uniref:hypothetical protein n=1 Tax=Maribacter sp. 2-571 TaxID=3417569 RepID=UPI003D346433